MTYLIILRSLAFVFLAACVSSLYAEPKQPKKIDSILTENCWFNGIYSQEKTIQGLPTLLKSSGRFLYDCKRGVIWLQTEPSQVGFIFAKNGDYYQVLESGELESIDSRYQNIIGRIMLMLFASKSDQIERLFNVEVANHQPLTFELMPKNQRLKKAVQALFVVQLPATESGHKQLEMTLLDSTNQTLRIVNTEQNLFSGSAASMEVCEDWLGAVAKVSCAHVSELQPLD